MSEFLTYANLGFLHITDVGGADHILFLLALAAIYVPRDWKDVLWVVTAFTIGHSVTLALAVTGALALPGALIEFLIPVTIVVTAIENIVVSDRRRALWRGHYRPVFAAVFGLVHGAGFANYLRSLFVDSVALPLFGFNVGIEVGQIAVLVVAFAALALLDLAIGAFRLPRTAPSALRLRAVAVSGAVAFVATGWALERAPW